MTPRQFYLVVSSFDANFPISVNTDGLKIIQFPSPYTQVELEGLFTQMSEMDPLESVKAVGEIQDRMCRALLLNHSVRTHCKSNKRSRCA